MSASITTQQYALIPRLIGEYCSTTFQGRPLIELIERNAITLRTPAPQLSDMLKQLVAEKRVKLSEEAAYFQHFPELLMAYFEARQAGQLLALQGAFIKWQLESCAS